MAEGLQAAGWGRHQWHGLVRLAVDADEWGQTIEAIAGYESLLSLIDSSSKHHQYTASDMSTIKSVRKTIDGRLGYLKLGDDPVPIKELKSILDKIAGLFVDEGAEHKSAPSTSFISKQLKAPAPSTKIRILIQQIGLKDAAAYNEPRIAISVVDGKGTLVAPSIETAISTQRSQSYIVFQKHVVLPVQYEDLVQAGHAIVFEFKHVKTLPAEKLSTKCWAFMDVDEVKPDTDIALELYKKPTDLLRKRLRLHTVKHLYLHLRLSLDPQ